MTQPDESTEAGQSSWCVAPISWPISDVTLSRLPFSRRL